MEVILPPIVQSDTLSKGVEQELMAYLDDVLFGPLLALLLTESIDVRENTPSGSVEAALRGQRIWYTDGTFSGRFSAAISRELRAMGASFNPNTKTFHLPPVKLPHAVRLAAYDSADRAKRVSEELTSTLRQIQENLRKAPTGIKLDGQLKLILENLERQYKRTAAKAMVGVLPDVTPTVQGTITKDYVTNLDRYITDFTEKRIVELRQKVQKNVMAGARPDKLAKLIEAEHGVSKRKAQFLAEQETSLLVSKYREARYKEAGSTRYVWSTSHDGRVRDDHRDLNGKTFYWASPPITNKHTGDRNHPGEDFGCRCVARPILSIEGD